MSECIETLNLWGEYFWGFAWPMLWQSSLLIAIVFAIDALFARRIRAAVRYALWMVVLVKLLLPPALALPTSAAWWLWPAKPALEPVIKTEAITFDTTVTPLPAFVLQPIPLAPPPPPKLSGAGWAVLGGAIASMALLLCLVFRWRRVAAKVRRSTTSSDFAPVLNEISQLARLQQHPRLKLVDDTQSPAVYGLFRPVILLPRALAEKLSPRQLRAVLLHEAIHLRRGDVWMNCAQTLLQIFYWWHPLLWLANVRIRRIREEAVDDAVMLALRHDADAYAPTLLEVAKFSFRRPLASLGLVGILESRSALRRRVERLVDFRPPRKAGLTFLSLCGVLLFSAVLLPMGCSKKADKPSATRSSGHASANSPTASGKFQPVLLTPGGEDATAQIFGKFAYDRATDTKTFVVASSTATDDLAIRTFTVGSAAFCANVREETGETNPVAGFMKLAANAGVDLSPPKVVCLSEGTGGLFIYASMGDMEAIKHIIADLHCTPTRVHIKARFIELPKKFFASAAANSLPPGMTNGGTLTAEETKNILRLLESQKGAEILAEPEATTFSGRQTQMRSTRLEEVITNYITKPDPGNPAILDISPHIAQIATGPILEVVPMAFADGYSIGLNATAELKQFFGYAGSDDPDYQKLPVNYATNSAGDKVPLPTSLPALQLCRAQGGKEVYDGQTLVLFPKPFQLLLSGPDKKRQEIIARHIQEAEKENGNKVLVVLVTATLVDSAGNPMHTDNDLRFASEYQPVVLVTNWAGLF